MLTDEWREVKLRKKKLFEALFLSFLSLIHA